jgi:putative peptidoglycan lipid II flippase
VAHYAIGDTKAPLRLASIRLVAVAALGYLCAIVLPRLLRIPAHWGAAGLTASAGVAGWMEFMMLRASLNRRVGATGLRRAHAARLWMAALLAAAAAFVVRRLLPPTHPILAGVLVLTVFGLVYFGTAALAGIALPVFGRMDRPRSRSAGL